MSELNSRPPSVFYFEILGYINVALGLVAVFVEANLLTNSSKVIVQANWPISILWSIFLIGLIYLTAWRRQSWGRWVFVGMFVLGLLGMVATISDSVTLFGVITSVLTTTIEASALAAIFTNESNAWFRSASDEA